MTGPGGGGTSSSADERAAVASKRQQGVLAGAMFIAGVLVSLPGSFLIQPAPPVGFYVLLATALGTGVVCLALPWERMSRLWFHALGGLATVEVTVAASFDDSYVFLYLFIAIFWAYVARSRIELGAQLGLISLGLLSPLVYEPDATRDTVQSALLWIPSLALMSILVMYMRERLEADRRAYRRFAEETVALAARIRGRPAEPVDPALLSPQSTLLVPPLPRLRLGWRRTAAAAAGMIVALCLVPLGLAAAGVELPKGVRMPFEELGIELPNQSRDLPVAEAPDAAVVPSATGDP